MLAANVSPQTTQQRPVSAALHSSPRLLASAASQQMCRHHRSPYPVAPGPLPTRHPRRRARQVTAVRWNAWQAQPGDAVHRTAPALWQPPGCNVFPPEPARGSHAFIQPAPSYRAAPTMAAGALPWSRAKSTARPGLPVSFYPPAGGSSNDEHCDESIMRISAIDHRSPREHAIAIQQKLACEGRSGVGITLASTPHWTARPESTLSGICI